MSVIPMLWIVWAAVAAILALLLLYRGTLTRYEEDQLFLDPAMDQQHQANDALLRKVEKIGPLVKVFTGATCVMSAAILGIYIWDAIRQVSM